MDEFIKRFTKEGINYFGEKYPYFSNDLFREYLAKEFCDDKGRFLVFHYPNYYPSGGMEDLVVRTNNIDGVINAMKLVGNEFTDNNYVNYYDLELNELFDIRADPND